MKDEDVEAIAISGTRSYLQSLKNSDLMKDVAMVLMSRSRYPKLKKIYFGGALGVDSMMLTFCSRYNSQKSDRINLFVVVPDVLESQPKLAKDAIARYAHELIELKNQISRKDGWQAFQKRNEQMIDNSDLLYAFPLKGKTTGGTINAIKYAEKCSKTVIKYELE